MHEYNRFLADQSYTYLGTDLLVVLGQQDFGAQPPDMRLYRGKVLGEMPPHVFAVAEEAWRFLRQTKCDQHIIASGETGAGKTECARLCLRYLCDGAPIFSKITAAQQLLEAFCHAEVPENRNASCCGHAAQLRFDKTGHTLQSCTFVPMLLQTMRVVPPRSPDGARRRVGMNFHIFYQMCETSEACTYLLPAEKYLCFQIASAPK